MYEIGIVAFGHLASGIVALGLVLYVIAESRRFQKLPLEWIVLAIGLAIFSLHGFSYFLCADSCSAIVSSSVVLGALAFGIGAVLVGKLLRSQATASIQERIELLQRMTGKIKQRVMRGALKEQDAHDIISSWQKELAELEVKRDSMK